ncbi:hypothetical protein PtA15_6A117 [Puccinia triticina]|nr:uncharacterized protein PtA15_6A117 [Puccinia triticina]WAQ85489.1 hypothetical protein PtA15_6A117 [Puccinia triticina]
MRRKAKMHHGGPLTQGQDASSRSKADFGEGDLGVTYYSCRGICNMIERHGNSNVDRPGTRPAIIINLQYEYLLR